MNKVILMGHIGKEPELREAGDSVVLSFSIATRFRKPDGNGGYEDDADWHDVSVWGKRAEGLSKILGTGDCVLVEGALKTRKFEHNGQTKWRTSVKAWEVELTGGGGKRSNEAAAPPKTESDWI